MGASRLTEMLGLTCDPKYKANDYSSNEEADECSNANKQRFAPRLSGVA